MSGQCFQIHHTQTDSTPDSLLNQRHQKKSLLTCDKVKKEKDRTVAQWSHIPSLDEKLCISFGNLSPRDLRKSGAAQKPSCWRSRVMFPVSDDLGNRVLS